MKCTTSIVTVGRAAPLGVATVPQNAENGDAILSAAETAKRAELIAGGVSPDRISFERVNGGHEPEESKSRKGKG